MKYITAFLFVLFSIVTQGQNNVLDIKVKDLNRNELSLSEVIDAERFTLLAVGGTWCKPCLDQKPFVASLGQQYPQHLKVVYLYYRDSPEKIKAKFGEDNVYDDYFLVDFHSIEQLAVIAYPTNILVDANGNIVSNDVSINDVGNLIK